jgi:hypothetical protein
LKGRLAKLEPPGKRNSPEVDERSQKELNVAPEVDVIGEVNFKYD